jgi:hypothetical protein
MPQKPRKRQTPTSSAPLMAGHKARSDSFRVSGYIANVAAALPPCLLLGVDRPARVPGFFLDGMVATHHPDSVVRPTGKNGRPVSHEAANWSFDIPSRFMSASIPGLSLRAVAKSASPPTTSPRRRRLIPRP